MPAPISRIESTHPPGPIMARTVTCGGVAIMCFTPATPAPTFAGQVQQVFDRLDQYLAKAGTSREGLLAAQVWLRNISEGEEFVELWNKWAPVESPPALSIIESHLGRADVLVEIKVQAALP